jgi:tetratricopeptide (TPR) repeat protein
MLNRIPAFETLTGTVLALLTVLPAAAQNIQGLPRRSPHSVVTQRVGITEISIDYHRPAVNGREIWGGLVPYGAVWRAGANDNTTITFSNAVKIEGKDLSAGTYGLHMIPTEDKWTVIFSTNSTSWGSFSYDEAEDGLRVEVVPQQSTAFEERLRYGFDEVDDNQAVVALHWEQLVVPFMVEVGTSDLVLQKIRNDLRHLPGFNWQGWNSAAAYCLQNDMNHEEALTWVERSISMSENSTNLFTKAGLLDQLDRTDEAQTLEARALGMASEAQVNALGYTYLFQRNDVEKAIDLFKKNVSDHPDSWNTYDSLGEAYAAQGATALAVEYYSKAFEMAPENQKDRIEGVLRSLENP